MKVRTLFGGAVLAILVLITLLVPLTTSVHAASSPLHSSSTSVLQVGQASTTTTLTAAPNPAVLGQAVTFTATVAPSDATGTVAFKDKGVAIAGCTARPLNESGQVTCTRSSLAAGVHPITAVYSGDASHNSSTSVALFEGIYARPTLNAGGAHACSLKADSSLGCWGGNSHGQLNVPSPNANWVQIGAGGGHTCGLKVDGTLTCWGDNSHGQLNVPSPNTNWVQVSGGVDHTCGVKADGTLTCWGDNSRGQLNVWSPNTNWVQVGAGYWHTCGLKADRTLACWGDNYSGQLNVPSPNANWVQVSTGWNHTCGLKANGVITCWGDNYSGQLNVPSPNANWVQISAGDDHTCGLKTDGTLTCWGWKEYGQTTIPSPNASWAQVSAGEEYTCGLKVDRTVRCWGRHDGEQAPVISLAPATLQNATVHVAYTQTITASGGSAMPYAFTVISGTLPNGLALKSDGTLHGAPTNAGRFNFTVQAQDANNIATTLHYTLMVYEKPTTVTTLSATPNPTMLGQPVIFTATVVPANAMGTVTFKDKGVDISGCTARPLNGRGKATCTVSSLAAGVHPITTIYSGDANYAPSVSATLFDGIHARLTIYAGGYHTCERRVDDTLGCWGDNYYGELNVPSPNANWVQVSAGTVHTCGLKADGTITCWGQKLYGQTTVPSPNANWVQVSAGWDHTCGLKMDGTLVCWGDNVEMQTEVPNPNANWIQVDLGMYHTCGLKADGTITCWGNNTHGETEVPSPNANWVQISAGDQHTCGLKADGTITCWGNNTHGETEVPSPNANWMQISAGEDDTCGLKTNGIMRCWGDDDFGETDVLRPNKNWVQVSMGAYHTCGLKADSTLTCWGLNNYGQVPAVIMAPASMPNPVLGMPYTQTITASGRSTAPYTFAMISGALPKGLTLKADGTLSGAPTSAGRFNFTVQAKDANNVAATLDYVFTVVPSLEETAPGIWYGNWREVSDPNATNGGHHISMVANDTASLTFTGISVTWLTLQGPDQGQAQVLIDGMVKRTVDNYTATLTSQVPIVTSGLAYKSHTLTVKVLGTKNQSSTGSSVIVDGFTVGAATTGDADPKVTYNTWQGQSNKQASGGSFRTSSTAGAAIKLTFSGTSIAWLTAKGPGYGQAVVFIDGKQQGKVIDLYAAKQQWGVPISFTGLAANKTHTIKIQVLGTRNANATGTSIIVDGFSGPITAASASLLPDVE